MTVYSFSGQPHFQWECMGHFYDRYFQNTIWLDTRNFARSITSITWTWASRTLFVYTEFTKKKVFQWLTLAAACSVFVFMCYWCYCKSAPSTPTENDFDTTVWWKKKSGFHAFTWKFDSSIFTKKNLGCYPTSKWIRLMTDWLISNWKHNKY